ncbi:unnamed protein product, partial [Diplocarpon coronariae]
MGPKPLDGASPTFAPASGASLAEEAAPPAGQKQETPLGDAQVDGTAENLGGSGLHDAQYEVEVKLSDIQGDASSPLFSVSTFEELG